MSRYGIPVGQVIGAVNQAGPPSAVSEDPCGVAAIHRIDAAIAHGLALLERLQGMEARINGARPTEVAKVPGETGYASSLLGDMYRIADSTDSLVNKFEQTISALERFA
jgi:hypothetical protein